MSQEPAATPFVDASGNALTLVLYKFDSCPYCRMVFEEVERLGLDVPMKDTRLDLSARQELLSIGGKTQVPCLVINGKPLYESSDIISFLHTVKTA